MQFFSTIALAALTLASSVFAAPTELAERCDTCSEMSSAMATLKGCVSTDLSAMAGFTTSAKANVWGQLGYAAEIEVSLCSLTASFEAAAAVMVSATASAGLSLSASELAALQVNVQDLECMISDVEAQFESTYGCLNASAQLLIETELKACIHAMWSVVTPLQTFCSQSTCTCAATSSAFSIVAEVSASASAMENTMSCFAGSAGFGGKIGY